MDQPRGNFLADASLPCDENLRVRSSGAIDLRLNLAGRVTLADETDIGLSNDGSHDDTPPSEVGPVVNGEAPSPF
jgi:hypothetical protein